MPGQSNVFIGGLENIDGDLVASGSVTAKDLVEVTTNDNEVQQSSSDGSDGLGVAMYDASDGDPIAVALVGAKVLVNAASGVSAGDQLTANGSTTAGQVAAAATGDEVIGRALTGSSSGEAEAIITGVGGDVN